VADERDAHVARDPTAVGRDERLVLLEDADTEPVQHLLRQPGDLGAAVHDHVFHHGPPGVPAGDGDFDVDAEGSHRDRRLLPAGNGGKICGRTTTGLPHRARRTFDG